MMITIIDSGMLKILMAALTDGRKEKVVDTGCLVKAPSPVAGEGRDRQDQLEIRRF